MSTTVRVLRWVLRWWPIMRGRGWILRLARLRFGRRAIRFDAGGGTLIDGGLSDWVIVWAFLREHKRDESFQHSLDLLQPGAVALDVGANLGVWSLLAARRGARVHAFEPVPELAARLRDHVALNDLAGSVVINPCAAGAEDASLPFFAVRDGNTGASSMARPREAADEIRVPVITLDSYIEREGIARVDVMKVDVEGAELFVFQGARRLLSAADAPVIFFEAGELLAARLGTSLRDLKRFLADCGYGIYRWRRGALMPVTVDERHEHEDLFAVKR